MSDRGTSRDVLLRVRVENLSTAGFKQVADGVKLITEALDAQIGAANRAEIKERELASSLTKLDQAARNLAGLDALIGRYKNFDTVLAQNEARVEATRKKLTDYRQSLEASSDTTAKAEGKLSGLVTAYEKAEAALTKQKAEYDRIGEALRKVGVDTANLAQAERDLNAVAEQTGQGRTKLSAALLDLTRNQRLAKEAAVAERAEQERLTTSLRAQADARAKMASEGQRQYQDALRRNAESAAAQKRDYDEALAATRARVDADRDAAAKRIAIERDATVQRIQAAQKETREQIIARDAVLASVRKFNDETRALTRQRVADETAAARATVDAIRQAQRAQAAAPAATVPGATAAATGSARGAAAPVGAFGLRPYELTNLGYQVNDVLTGLASGQGGIQILAQQGGQFFQIFGMAALRWLPVVAVAVGAVTVGVEALTARLQTLSSNREFTALLTANKYAADQNVGSLTTLRKELRDLGVAWDDAGKAIRTALDANVRPDKLREVALAAQAMALVTGKTVPEAMKDLTTGISGGIEAFDRLVAVYPAIGAKNAEYIRGLFLAGKEQQAQIEILRLLGETYDKARKEKLSPFDEAVIKLRTSWNSFIDKLGESSAFNSVITNVTSLVDGLSKGIEAVDRFVSTLDGPKVQAALKIISGYLSVITYPTRTAAGLVGSAVGAAAGYMTTPSVGTGAPGDPVTAPIPGAAGRFSTGSLAVNTEELKTLVAILAAATSALPPGYRAEAISTFRPGATVRDTGMPSEHASGRAIDVRIVDDTGKPVPGSMAAGGPLYDMLDKAVVGIAAERGLPIAVGSTFSHKDAGHYSIGGREAATTSGRIVPDDGGGVTSGPTAAAVAAGATALRNAERQLDLVRASSQAEEERIKREEILLRLQNEGIKGSEAQAIIDREIALFRDQKSKETYQRDQDNAKQRIQDGVNAVAIEAAGSKAVADAVAAGRENYEELYAIRKRGEGEARADIQKRKQEQDQLDTAEKQVSELRRQNLNQNKSQLDQLTEAVNLRYDNEIKQLEKLRERSSTVDRERYDSLIKRTEVERAAALRQATFSSYEAAGKEALTTRQTLVQTYNALEAAGDITIAEKEKRTKEAFDLTGTAILGAASNLEKFLATAEGLALPPEKIALLTAKVAEFRSQAQYVSPLFKEIKTAVEQSFSTGLTTAFNTVGEAMGGLVAGTKKFKDVIDATKQAAISFFAQLLKDIATAILKYEGLKLASSLFGIGGGGGGGGIGGLLGGLFGDSGGGLSLTSGGTFFGDAAGASAAGFIFHGGGVVGQTVVPRRPVQQSWFTNAPRYHSGQVVGLAPDEQAAILQRGEEILSRGSPRNIMNGGGGSAVNIRSVLVMDEGQIPAAMASAHGERVIVQTLVRNAATIRGLVKG
jgi:hypothetical protein